MRKLFLTIAILSAFAFPALAEMEHHPASHSKPMAMAESELTPFVTVDGFDISFDIMTHKDYQKMMKDMKMEPMKAAAGTTHHVAVTIRKEGVKVEDASATLKVVSPDGKEETRVLNYNPDMMYQYVGHFTMAKKGKYQLQITFEVGKEKHQGMVDYEVKYRQPPLSPPY